MLLTHYFLCLPLCNLCLPFLSAQFSVLSTWKAFSLYWDWKVKEDSEQCGFRDSLSKKEGVKKRRIWYSFYSFFLHSRALSWAVHFKACLPMEELLLCTVFRFCCSLRKLHLWAALFGGCQTPQKVPLQQVQCSAVFCGKGCSSAAAGLQPKLLHFKAVASALLFWDCPKCNKIFFFW